MFCLYEIGFTSGEWVRYLSAGRAGVVKMGSSGPRMRTNTIQWKQKK